MKLDFMREHISWNYIGAVILWEGGTLGNITNGQICERKPLTQNLNSFIEILQKRCYPLQKRLKQGKIEEKQQQRCKFSVVCS